MKKLLLVSLLVICAASFLPVHGQHPIPSYATSVNGRALFVSDSSFMDGKTTIKIKRICSMSGGVPESPDPVAVWVFTIDQTTILGPFYLGCDQVLEVPIDDREWGVLVESDDEVIVDVWIE
jgi:hypothetical protein